MDAEYLQKTVGEYLAVGLAEVSSVRPADPIEFLALWLLKQTANQPESEPRVSETVSYHEQDVQVWPSAEPRKAGSTGSIPNPPGLHVLPPRSVSLPATSTAAKQAEGLEPKLETLQEEEEEGKLGLAAPPRKAGSTGSIPNPPGPTVQPRSASMPATVTSEKQSEGQEPETFKEEEGKLAPTRKKAESTGSIPNPPGPTEQPRSVSMPATVTSERQSEGQSEKQPEGPKLETLQEEEGKQSPTREKAGSTGSIPNPPGPTVQPRSVSMPATVTSEKRSEGLEPKLETLQEEEEGKLSLVAPTREKAGSTGSIPNPPGPTVQPRSVSMPATTTVTSEKQSDGIVSDGKLSLAAPTREKAGSTSFIPNPPGPTVQPRSVSMPATVTSEKQSEGQDPKLETLQEEEAVEEVKSESEKEAEPEMEEKGDNEGEASGSVEGPPEGGLQEGEEGEEEQGGGKEEGEAREESH